MCMAIELDIPGVTVNGKRQGLRVVRVGHVSEAGAHTQGSALSLVDIDGTSFNGKEADLGHISAGSARMVRYSSRTPITDGHLLARIAHGMGRVVGRDIQGWPFITPSFQQQAEVHATDPGIYGLGKALLPPRLQGRAWREATMALTEGHVAVVGNSRLIDGRFARALHRHAVRSGLGTGRVTFVHVKP